MHSETTRHDDDWRHDADLKPTPTCHMMIGIPGSGKSTSATAFICINTVVISTDNIVEEYARSIGKTYNDVWQSYIKTATTLMYEQLELAILESKDIVWDQTNLSAKVRTDKLAKLAEYKKIAVVCYEPDETELFRRLANRPGKDISAGLIHQMRNTFEVPTLAEGFNEIMEIK